MRGLTLRTEIGRSLTHEEIDANFRNTQIQLNRLNEAVFGEEVPHLSDTHLRHDEICHGDEGPVHERPERPAPQGRKFGAPFDMVDMSVNDDEED
jgi:hypothetical protein